MKDFDPIQFLYSMAALIICITIHEFSHAYSAWKSGDETPKAQGRISLNPIDHLDPVGTIMMVVSSYSGFGIGWGKPVMVNPYNFRKPRWDNLKVSLWGPLSNLITAAVLGGVLRFTTTSLNKSAFNFLAEIVIISVSLALFNLIPIAPLDGSHIMSSLLPREQAMKYDMFMARFGMFLFLGMVLLGVVSKIIGPPMIYLINLIMGPHVLMRYFMGG